MSDPTEAKCDWIAFALRIIEQDVDRARLAARRMALYIAALEPCPKSAEYEATLLLWKVCGFELDQATKEYRAIRAEVRRERMKDPNWAIPRKIKYRSRTTTGE